LHDTGQGDGLKNSAQMEFRWGRKKDEAEGACRAAPCAWNTFLQRPKAGLKRGEGGEAWKGEGRRGLRSNTETPKAKRTEEVSSCHLNGKTGTARRWGKGKGGPVEFLGTWNGCCYVRGLPRRARLAEKNGEGRKT